VRDDVRRWLKPLWVLLAIVFLIEAWLWDRLEPIVAWIVDLIPWHRVKALFARSIDRLSPAATLLVFLIPVAVLVPIKMVGLWFLAHGHWISAFGMLLLAKLAGLGTTAFVFDVCRDKLLQLVWFRMLYDSMIALREWAHSMVDPLLHRLRRLIWLTKPHRAGRFLRRMWRIRRRLQHSHGHGSVGRPSAAQPKKALPSG
jgi:hypothetical protein